MNSQNIQSLWRRSKTKTSGTDNATISSAAAASTSGGEEVEDVPAAQNKSQNSGPSPNCDVLLLTRIGALPTSIPEGRTR